MSDWFRAGEAWVEERAVGAVGGTRRQSPASVPGRGCVIAWCGSEAGLAPEGWVKPSGWGAMGDRAWRTCGFRAQKNAAWCAGALARPGGPVRGGNVKLAWRGWASWVNEAESRRRIGRAFFLLDPWRSRMARNFVFPDFQSESSFWMGWKCLLPLQSFLPGLFVVVVRGTSCGFVIGAGPGEAAESCAKNTLVANALEGLTAFTSTKNAGEKRHGDFSQRIVADGGNFGLHVRRKV